MMLRTAFLLLPMIALAQEHAPKFVDDELRARVTAFYQNFLDDSFSPRKAEPFVAEDTKEFFYNAGKERYKSFEIGKITYSDDFTKAVVVVIGKMDRIMSAQKVEMAVPKDTHWKIEDGKWCWTYHSADYSFTPMGGQNPPGTPMGGEVHNAGVKPKDSSPEAMRAAGSSLLQQQPMGLDKSEVTFNVDQASSNKIVFTNDADGDVQIALDGPEVRGLTAKLDKATVPGHGTAVLSLQYDPSDKRSEKGMWEPKGSITFRIYASPFSRIFTLHVQFVAASK